MAIQEVSFKFTSNAKDIENQLKTIDKQLAKLQNSKAELQVKADKLASAKKEISGLDVELKQLAAAKATLKIDGTEAKEAAQMTGALNRAMDVVRAKKATLQVETQQLKGADTELNKVNRQMDTLNDKKADLQVQKGNIEEAGEGLTNLAQSLNRLDNSRTTINISSNIQQIGKALDGVSKKMFSIVKTASRVSGALAIAGGKKVLDVFGEFEQTMNQVGAISNAGEKDLARLSERVLKLGADSVFSATEVGQAALELSKGGLSQAQLEAGALAQTIDLAAASGLSMEEAAISLSNAMNAFGIEASETNNIVNAFAGGANASSADVSDLTQALAQVSAGAVNAGLDLNETVGALSAFADNGIKGSDAGTSLKTMLQRLIPMTDRAADMMDHYGLQFYDANGKMDEMTVIAEKLKNALGDLSEADRIEALNSMFGSDSSRAASILMREGADGIQAYIDATNDATAAQRMADAYMKGWKGTIESTSGSIETMAINIGDKLAPAFTPLARLVGNLADKMSNFLIDNEEDVSDWVNSVQSHLEKFADAVINFEWADFGSGLIEGFKDLGDGLKSFYETFKPVFDFLKNRITDLGDGSFAKGLGKIPAEFIKWAVAIKGAGLALKALGGLTGIVGKLTGFSIGSLFGRKDGEGGKVATTKFDTGKMLTQFKNLALIAGVIGNVMLAAEAIKQVNDKVPDNLGSVAKKMGAIVLAIGAMGGLVAVAGILTKDEGTATAIAGLATVALLAIELMVCAEALKQVNDKVSANIKQVAKKIANIGIAITAMGVMAGIVGAVMATGIGAAIVLGGLATIALIAGDLILMAEAIHEIDTKVPEDFSGVKGKIESIADVVTHITSLDFGGLFGLIKTIINTIHVDVVATMVGKFTELADELLNLETAINQLPVLASLEGKIESLAGTIGKIQEHDFGGVLNLLDGWTDNWNLDALKTTVKNLSLIAISLKIFGKASDDLPRDIGTKMGRIQTAIANINAITLGEIKDAKKLKGVAEAVTNLLEIANSLNKLASISIQSASVNLRVQAVSDVVEELEKLLGQIDAMAESGVLAGGNFSMPAVIGAAEAITTLATKLSEFGAEPIKSASINLKIQGVMDIIEKLSELEPLLDDTIDADSFRNVISGIGVANGSGMVELVTRLQAFLDVPFNKGALLVRIDNLKEIMTALSNFDLEGTANSGEGISIVAQLTGVLEQLAELTTQFNTTGNNYATDLLAGFDSVGLPKEMPKAIDTVITALGKLEKSFKEIGRKYGDALKKSFGEGVKDMSDAVDTEITKISGFNARLIAIGNTLGTSLMTNFSTAIQNMARDVGAQIDAIQRAVNNLNFSSMSVIPRSGNIGPFGYATGGEVQYRASGGVMQPRGTDTVPAMLTPGEFVMRKQAVDTIGTPFMQRLNNLDIQGAFRQLTNNFNGRQMTQRAYHSVVNNIHTDNRQNKPNIKMTTNGGANYSLRRLNKYARGLA